MSKYRFGFFFIILTAAFMLMTGCLGDKGNDSLSPVSVSSSTEPTTTVRFEISGQKLAGSIRAQTAIPPKVYFELRLLDRTSITNPVIRMIKQAAIVASGSVYNAEATFNNVPVLPAIGSMTIEGGYLLGAGDLKFSKWAGKKDLVAASENSLTLVGVGDKSATDVSVNLLEQLIAAPANVATLATPIFAKVDAIVAGLTLTSSTVYADALQAYNAAYAVPSVPADAEFAPPANFTSLAFPKKDASVSLTMNSFANGSEAFILLMNRSSIPLTPSWMVPPIPVGSIRASVKLEGSADEHPITPEQKFHLMLRNFKKPAGGSAAIRPGVRPSLRAVAVGDDLTFKAYILAGTVPETTVFGTVTAKCKRIALLNGRRAFIFLDVADTSMAEVENVLDDLVAAWNTPDTGIYDTNRRVFGAEPTGTFYSGDVNDINTENADMYILISRKIYSAGYFWGRDLYAESIFAESNNKKIFYLQLDSEITVYTRNDTVNGLSATIAHEFQHMIHFWQKRTLPEANAWLDESMSGYAEHINGFKIENGKNQSKALQSNNYFVRMSQIRVDKWYVDGDTDLVGSAHYGKAFLFGVWFAQNYGGADGSVQNLLSVPLTEKAAVEAFTGEPFDKTFAKFMLAMTVNNTTGGLFGFFGLDLLATYDYGNYLADVTLTGPLPYSINLVTGDTGVPTIAPYAAAYIKIVNGNGNNVVFNATLPAGISLFHLRKD